MQDIDMFPEIVPGSSKEESTTIRRLVFDRNWNNKLLCFNFTVILPVMEKFEIGEKLDIRIKDRFFCYATVSHINPFKLSDIIALGYSRLDSGMQQKEFMELMENSYGKRSWWNGQDTQMILVFLSKIEQLNMAI